MLRFDPQPPAAALAWWQKKVPVTSDEFEDLSTEARARAFTVAGLHKLDQVSAVHKALETTIATGRPMEEFKRDMGRKLDGKLSAYQLETIYRTNVQSAYHAGRYSQMMRVSENMPFWRYVAVDDSRTRPSHKALNGIVRRFDDPFWDDFYPPNGFRCRCTVQALSDRQMRQKGYEAGEGTPGMLLWVDPQTGAETPVVPMPDQGFYGNVGKQAWQADFGKYRADLKQATLAGIGAACKKEGCYPQLKRFIGQGDLEDMETAMWARTMAHGLQFGAWVETVLTTMRPKGELYPVGNLPARVLRKLETQPRLALVSLDDKQLVHMARAIKEARGTALTADELKELPARLASAQWYRDKEKGNYLFCWLRAGEEWVKVVVEMDYHIDGRKNLVANHIITSGVTRQRNLEDGNLYEEL